ncbi:MAG: type VI secretion system baseplate subunit TssK, partial [Deltaproteobacteria bacterium]|nr:type VI secretion system baseplate subunit TssK [Deltaproteobacteria bacterium]
FLLEVFQPYPWGLVDLEISGEALANFTFEVLKLDLWLADGRRLLAPGSLELAPRSFAQVWTNTDDPLAVSLAVPIFSRTSANVNTEENRQGFRRKLFNPRPEPEMVPDLLGEGPAGRVETLGINAYVLFGTEAAQAREAVTLIPLARLQRDGEKVYLHKEYAPPSVKLYADHPLRRLMQDVLEFLKAKSRQLEEYKFSPLSHPENFGGRTLALITVLGVVSRHIARLHFLLAPQALHPYQAFTALRELAAELTIFSPGLTALGESLIGSGGLRPYDHLDPYPSFAETKNLIRRLLESVALGPEVTVIFRREERRLTADLPVLSGNYTFWLSVRSGEDPQATARSLMTFGKLAAPDRAESLISYNLPGVALSLLEAPPLGLPRNPNTVYFSIRQADPLWAEALAARQLVLFWDQAPPSALVTLSGSRL